ncbi:MAG: hypothetical protein AAF413_02960 [Patescibacteria group bacterium]
MANLITTPVPDEQYLGGHAPYVANPELATEIFLSGQSYRPSADTAATLIRLCQSTGYVGLVGPAACGKNALMSHLVDGHDIYVPLVSSTSRPIRRNNGVWEQDGVHYMYRTEQEQLADAQAGLFIEAAVIHDSYISGQHISQVEQALEAGKTVINEFEVYGVDVIRRLHPEWRAIGFVASSMDERNRIFAERSGSDGNTDDARRRNLSAAWELDKLLNKDAYAIFVNEMRQVNVEDLPELIAANAERLHKMIVDGANNGYQGHDDEQGREIVKNSLEGMLEMLGMDIEEVRVAKEA